MLDRRPQEVNTAGAGLAQSWLAWEERKAVGEMEKVVRKEIKYEGEPEAKLRWVQVNNNAMEWNASTQKFNEHNVIQ